VKDIVEELRGIQTTCPSLHSTFNSAANEIERLRFVIKTLRFEAENSMGVTVNEPFDLMSLLAKMRAAKALDVNMSVWDSEIKIVEDAVATIKGIRSMSEVGK